MKWISVLFVFFMSISAYIYHVYMDTYAGEFELLRLGDTTQNTLLKVTGFKGFVFRGDKKSSQFSARSAVVWSDGKVDVKGDLVLRQFPAQDSLNHEKNTVMLDQKMFTQPKNNENVAEFKTQALQAQLNLGNSGGALAERKVTVESAVLPLEVFARTDQKYLKTSHLIYNPADSTLEGKEVIQAWEGKNKVTGRGVRIHLTNQDFWMGGPIQGMVWPQSVSSGSKR